MLTSDQITNFLQNGFLVLPAMSDAAYCELVIQFAQTELNLSKAPIEFEADTQYPGAPMSRDAEGGQTARRLLQAYARSTLLSDWATQGTLAEVLTQLLGAGVRLSQAHHNCIMTKQARFSSVTGWHRDSRYWHFQRSELITVWLALRDEYVENGCLLVLPGSHQWSIEQHQLDAAQFLLKDVQENHNLLAQSRAVPLRQGDVLLFSSNLFHAAGRNQTDQTKFSMVYTYRAADNLAIAGTRSADYLEIELHNKMC